MLCLSFRLIVISSQGNKFGFELKLPVPRDDVDREVPGYAVIELRLSTLDPFMSDVSFDVISQKTVVLLASPSSIYFIFL